jgi:hypothetical protein
LIYLEISARGKQISINQWEDDRPEAEILMLEANDTNYLDQWFSNGWICG